MGLLLTVLSCEVKKDILLENGIMLKMLNYKMLRNTHRSLPINRRVVSKICCFTVLMWTLVHAFSAGSRHSRDLPYVGIFLPESSNRPFSWGRACACWPALLFQTSQSEYIVLITDLRLWNFQLKALNIHKGWDIALCLFWRGVPRHLLTVKGAAFIWLQQAFW